MTDSTPTAVTVSDRMRELVMQFGEAYSPTAKYRSEENLRRFAPAHCEARDALLREIARLEAKAVLWDDILVDDTGAVFTPPSIPVQANVVHRDPSLPQTLGEEIRGWDVHGELLAAYATAIRDAERLRIARDSSSDVDAPNIRFELQAVRDQATQRRNELFADRSRLLTALEETTKERDSIYKIANQYTWELKQLRDSSVLQKEQLDKHHAKAGPWLVPAMVCGICGWEDPK